MAPSPRRPWPIVWLVAAVSVPCLFSSFWAFSGLPAVMATGMCPPAPPDIPAYACSPLEYVLRMTLGPWALIGHVTLWCAWLGLAGVVWLTLRAVLRSTSSSADGHIPQAQPLKTRGGSND